jgi:hypothetical protein
MYLQTRFIMLKAFITPGANTPLENYQMANNNMYGFFDLISKIESFDTYVKLENKLENKHIR